MEKKTNKPRLVFFQWKHGGLPSFLQLHMQLHVKCLSEFFDVVLINKDCDYRQICDTYQPDLALFESGYRTSISKKIVIKNTSAYSGIPKLGLHNGDPWCECRTGFISDMEHWGIDTFFSIGATTAEHTPELAENLFVWPNFLDSDIHRDYGQVKNVPVLFNGYINTLYPWRQKIFKKVSNRYPSLIFPHLGYENHSPIMIHGEQYARIINASWFVPACGTLAKEVVRKHFEIPGSKSCLIAEKTPSLEAAGFIDMQNCVFADEKEVLDKLDYLFQNTQELEKIIKAGYQLVHTRHTLKQRDQIFQWFTLYNNLKPNQRIVQSNPFESLMAVEKSSGIQSGHIACNGLNIALLRQGDEKLWAGKYDEAEALYLKCLNYIHWMSEPKLKLSICNLYKGNIEQALAWITEPIKNNLRDYRAFDPDPVEWTYFIICLLCQGKLNKAVIRVSQFPSLNHPELDRIRWAIACLQKREVNIPIPQSSILRPRYTIHQLPQLSFVEWVNNLCNMLKACQQFQYAQILSAFGVSHAESSGKLQYNSSQTIISLRKHLLSLRIKWLQRLNYTFEILHIPNPRPGLPPTSEIGYLIRLSRCLKLNYLKTSILKYFSHVYSCLKLLDPASATKIKNDEFIQALDCLLHDEDINTAIVIGRPITTELEAILKEKKGRCREQSLFCINVFQSQFVPLQRKKKGDNLFLKSYEIVSNSLEFYSSELDNHLKKVKQENGINFFDLVLINSSKFEAGVELAKLHGARFIIFNKLNIFHYYKHKQELISDSSYTLVAHNPLHKDGYAIFKKLTDSFSQATSVAEGKVTPSFSTVK